MSESLISVRNLSCNKSPGNPIFKDVSFDIDSGEVIILTGKSGSGKTTILKSLAHLNVYEGEIKLRGKTPTAHGVPLYRTRVLYVPQRPSMLPGTPRRFLTTIRGYQSRKRQPGAGVPSPESDPFAVARGWGLEDDAWDREWTSLSGGEAQRLALAVAVGLEGTEILLLDEPTSALDAETTELVEKYLKKLIRSEYSSIKAIVWITHSEEQGKRCGSRWLDVEAGHGIHENGHDESHSEV